MPQHAISFTPSLAGAYISSPKLDVSGSTPTEVVILEGSHAVISQGAVSF